MENEALSNSTDLRVASFSCYLKPHEGKLGLFDVDKCSGSETGKGVPFKRFFHGFRSVSPCLTKKTVYVNKMESYGTKGDEFSFPDLNPDLEVVTAKQKQFKESSRKFFEVPSSETKNKGDIIKNLERKMSVLSWDAIPKVNYENVSVTDDDVASDTSSDLFEIENLSRTGSFAEFSSAYDEKKTVHTSSTWQTVVKNKTGMRKKSGLLGCKGHQSVKVAEPVCKTNYKSKHRQHQVPFDRTYKTDEIDLKDCGDDQIVLGTFLSVYDLYLEHLFSAEESCF